MALISPPNPPQPSKSYKISSGAYGSVSFDSYNPKIAIKKSADDVFSASVCETSILTFLNHPNIIKPLSINYSETGACEIYMERYLGNFYGNDWLSYAEKIKKSPSTLLIRILGEIAAAIRYMHGCGIIHADLKTQNILFDIVKVEGANDPSSGRPANNWKIKPIICDFGVSVINNSKYSDPRLQTLNYRAPEVDHKYYNSGNIMECAISEKIDIWSFGCIAFELFTGNVFMKPKSGDFPSWLVCATKFGIGAGEPKPFSKIEFENDIKSQLFAMEPSAIRKTIIKSMEDSSWKYRMKLSSGVFVASKNKHCDISSPMFDLFEEIITGCLQPNPNSRWESERVFNFFRTTCGDIIDMKLSPEIINPVPHEVPKFKIAFFEEILDSGMEKITDHLNTPESQKNKNNYKKIREYMEQYEHANLLSKIIEMKYYEKKNARRTFGTDFAAQITLSSCMLAAILLEIEEMYCGLEQWCPSIATLCEITSELCGNLLG